MSVINQVLNQLEQRGVQVTSEQVRPVHGVRDTRKFKEALVIALLAVFAVFAWRALPIGKPAAVPPKIVATDPTPQMVVAADTGVAVMPQLTTGLAIPVSRLSFELSSVPLPSIPGTDTRHQGKNTTSEATDAKPTRPSARQVVNQAIPAPSNSQPVKQVSAAQQADAEFRKAAAFMQQGRINDALSGYEAALRFDAGHEAARQALVALLLEAKKGSEVEQVLQDGLKSKPAHSGFAMLLARLQVERGELDQAIATLEVTLPHVGQQADYQAFYAALLQRKSRHREAAEHYQIALKAVPNKGVWLMGYGISLQALSRPDEAKEAFQRALDTKTLSPELQAFVQQKIKGL